jgi:hypothetical protein
MIMKPKDMFSLAVRILGLVFVYQGLLSLPGVTPMIFSGTLSNALMGAFTFAWPLLVGRWLLRGAPLLMRMAFPDAGGQSESGRDFAAGIGKKMDG